MRSNSFRSADRNRFEFHLSGTPDAAPGRRFGDRGGLPTQTSAAGRTSRRRRNWTLALAAILITAVGAQGQTAFGLENVQTASAQH
jgi:hypothetical protein